MAVTYNRSLGRTVTLVHCVRRGKFDKLSSSLFAVCNEAGKRSGRRDGPEWDRESRTFLSGGPVFLLGIPDVPWDRKNR